MERRGEAAVLADPLLTELFQDAYDGRLPVWGVATPAEVKGGPETVWMVGGGDQTPAAARFEAGSVSLALSLEPGRTFDVARLPIPRQQPPALLGNTHRAGRCLAGQHDSPARRGPVTGACVAHPGDTTGMSYTVFIQAVDDAGVKAGQLDRLPCGGGCLTTSWQRGDLVGEWLELPISAGAPPGHYRLITGLCTIWRPARGCRCRFWAVLRSWITCRWVSSR